MSSYSNFTDSSLSNFEKIRQETAELQRQLLEFAQELADEDEEDMLDVTDDDVFSQGQEKENSDLPCASASWQLNWEETNVGAEKQETKSKTHPSTSTSSQKSSKSSTLSAFGSFDLGKDLPDDSACHSQKRKPLVTCTPSTLSGKVSSSISTRETLASSAERQPAQKPNLPEPASFGRTPKEQVEIPEKSGRKSEKQSSSKKTKLAVCLENRVPPHSESDQSFSSKNCQSFVVNGKVYEKPKEIGKGGSSQVYQVIASDGEAVALKRVNLEESDEAVRNAFLNEIKLLERLRNTNRVVRLLDYEHRESEKALYIVMEKGETDFSSHLKTRRNWKEQGFENLIRAYWQEMLLAVQVIHKEGIVHSDLKPSNFLIVGGTFKLIDFGIARNVPKDVTSVTTTCQMGTLNYMSPEAMNNISSGADFKYRVPLKSDVWSLGCILYSMVYGRTPFQDITNPWQKMLAIIGGDPNRPREIRFPPVDDRGNPVDELLLDVMKRCFVRNAKNRASVDQLLEHPYLKNRKAPVTPENLMTKNPVFQSLAATAWDNSPRTNDRLVKELLGQLQQENISEKR